MYVAHICNGYLDHGLYLRVQLIITFTKLLNYLFPANDEANKTFDTKNILLNLNFSYPYRK